MLPPMEDENTIVYVHKGHKSFTMSFFDSYSEIV